MEGRKIFSDPSNCPCAAVVEVKASPSGRRLGSSSTLHWFITGGSKTARFYYRIMTDLGFESSAAPGHAAHLNSQLPSAGQGQTIFNPVSSVLGSVNFSVSNI